MNFYKEQLLQRERDRERQRDRDRESKPVVSGVQLRIILIPLLTQTMGFNLFTSFPSFKWQERERIISGERSCKLAIVETVVRQIFD